MKSIARMRALAGAVLVAGACAPAEAQSVAEYYKGRTVTLIAAASAGGGYDQYGRPTIKYLARHLPGNPNMIIQFMPGAGGAKAANYLYNVAARDGAVLGLISNAAPVFQVLDPSVKYDASKFHYIGRAASMQYAIMVWHTAGVKTLEDMKTKEVVFGSSGKSQSNHMVPIVLKTMFGLKAKVIAGYPGTNEITMALEKGELSGRAGAWSSWIVERPQWLKDGTVIPVAQAGLERAVDLPNSPLLLDLAKTPEDRAVLELLASDAAIGRGFVTTPGVPADRVQALRRAFDATMKDAGYLAETKKMNLIIEPMTGERLQEIVNKTVAAPPHIIARTKQVLEWN